MGWCRINTSLPHDEEVYYVKRALRVTRHHALGLLLDWITYLQKHSRAGETSMTREDVDAYLEKKGAAAALEHIGWVELDDSGCIRALDFNKYNDSTEKSREMWARQKSAQRSRKKAEREAKCQADMSTNCPADCPADMSTPCLADKCPTREEKENNIEFEHSSHSSLLCTEEARAGETPAQADGVGSVGERKAPRPANAGEVEAYLATITALKLTPPERQKAAMAFYDEMEAVGWVNRYGKNVWDWEAYARRWAMSWAENAHTPFRNGRPAESYSRNDRTSNGKGVNNYDIR